MISFIYIICNHNKVVMLNDYRLNYSDTYKISSKTDLKIIDKIIRSMYAIETNESNNGLRIGGYIVIEEKKGDNIKSYRIQGKYVTKYIYKNNKNHLISTTYYELDDTYYQLLQDVCDKHRKIQ